MGSRTGVFVGMCSGDYYQRMLQQNPDSFDAYLISGSDPSMAAGRISYLLGLQGSSFVLDTACSSSLVAVHVACQSLRSGECDMALAGGVSLMLNPENTIGLSRADMLSPDGRCRTFDAEANGFVRGEGCGIIILKRLSVPAKTPRPPSSAPRPAASRRPAAPVVPDAATIHHGIRRDHSEETAQDYVEAIAGLISQTGDSYGFTATHEKPLLFNVEQDLGERIDRAAEQPEIVGRMLRKFDALSASMRQDHNAAAKAPEAAEAAP